MFGVPNTLLPHPCSCPRYTVPSVRPSLRPICDHAAVCARARDRNCNTTRWLAFSTKQPKKRASNHREKKSGLLHPHSDSDGVPQRTSLDRPADGEDSIPEARDFAVTNCLLPVSRKPRPGDGDHPQPVGLPDARKDVPRHSPQTPTERHPFQGPLQVPTIWVAVTKDGDEEAPAVQQRQRRQVYFWMSCTFVWLRFDQVLLHATSTDVLSDLITTRNGD